MSVLIRKIIKGYLYVNNELSDPRTLNLPLMSSPFPVIAIVGAYLYFVLKLGPKLMESRKPFKLDKIIIAFNIFQILACSILVYQFVMYAFPVYNWRCQPVDYSSEPLALRVMGYTWYYFLIKLLDLTDTIFFVLKKKSRQVSFLHVYHHAGMCFLSWIGVKYLAGGHSTFLGFINCIVHIIMYFYYLLTAWDEKYKQSIWWKKHLTQLQMIQFLMFIIIYGQTLFQTDCGYPKLPVVLLLAQDIFIFSLFFDFYIKNYINSKPKKEITLGEVPISSCAQSKQNGTSQNGTTHDKTKNE